MYNKSVAKIYNSTAGDSRMNIKYTIAAIVSVVLYVGMTYSRADDNIDYYLSLGSWHEHGDYNEFNPGLGATYKLREYDNSVKLYGTGGAYYNSEKRVSVYAGAGASIEPVTSVKLGLDVIAATGYKAYPVVVAPTPYVEVSRFKVLLIPPFKTSPLTLGLQVRF